MSVTKQSAPEVQALRQCLRDAVSVRLAAERKRRAGTMTSRGEFEAERDALRAARAIHQARRACEAVGIRPSRDTLRLGRRFTGKYTWDAVLNDPKDVAFDEQTGQWV